MSVLLETSAGDIVIDLLTDYAPELCENFLKLCKLKYYNFCPVHAIQKDFSFQTGDPLGPLSPESDGGVSAAGLLSGRPSDRLFPAPFHPKLKHLERGTVSMATAPSDPSDPDAPRVAASQFVVTLGDDTSYLDGRAAIFGKVVEGLDVLDHINGAVVDERGNPLVDIRVAHTVVLDDPFPDPPGLRAPSASPLPTRAQLATVRIADAADLRADDGLTEEELDRRRREREARAQALTLEMMGDLPFAEVKPPENVLFVCKLNPVTGDEDLELIFGRFGRILSCEVVRDHKTGDSLQYAFVEFEEKEACERAYFKMQDVLIDDRRIHVDFSQSVSRLSDLWRQDENAKRRSRAGRGAAGGAGGGRGGGWGGIAELEKKRQYRDEYEDDDDGYKLVHTGGGKRQSRRQSSRSPSRSRSPQRDGEGARSGRHEVRQRDGVGNGNRDENEDGNRDGNKDRDRNRDRDRDQDGDRYRNRDRCRDVGSRRGSERDHNPGRHRDRGSDPHRRYGRDERDERDGHHRGRGVDRSPRRDPGRDRDRGRDRDYDSSRRRDHR